MIELIIMESYSGGKNPLVLEHTNIACNELTTDTIQACCRFSLVNINSFDLECSHNFEPKLSLFHQAE